MILSALVLLVLLALPYSLAFSQCESAQATGPGTYLLIGGEYDDGEGFSQTLGVAQRVYKSVWAIPRGTLDREGNIDADFVYWVNDWLGVVAGPALDWSNPTDADHTSYLVGASGLVAHWQIEKNIGISGGYKYKFSYKDGDRYIDGWRAAVLLTFALGPVFE